jgi:hypothetical protein
MRTIKLLALIAAGLAGCADNPYDPDAPAIDPNAPRVHITSPERGTFAGPATTLEVRGTVSDDSGEVASVTVNGVVAAIGADGTWSVYVPVKPGTNLLHAIAKDKQGNTGKESRAVVAGPTVALDRKIDDAITVTLSSQTFSAIGQAAAGFLESDSLMTVITPMNPVLDIGGGPDCLYAQASITSMTVGDADILLAPQSGGVFLAGELRNVRIGMYLQYAVSCLNGSRNIVIAADRVSLQGMLKIGLAGRNFDIRLDQPVVQITGFDLQLGGIPGAVVDMLSLDTAMGPILAWAAERVMVPMLNKSFAGLNETKTMDVLGTPVDIDVRPSRIQFSNQGGLVMLDTSLRARGDTGRFVFVANTVPTIDLSQGFQLAVADDAANQLLTSLWSAKGLDKTLELRTGSYGEVGRLYDSVQIEAMVPPFIDASGGGLTLTVGDLMATFRLDGRTTTQVAINAEVALEVVKGADGNLRIDVGTPTTYVDILDQGIEGANPLSNAQFETVVSFALSRIVSVGSGTVGAIPLPSIGGVGLQNLKIKDEHGYLIVEGAIQ